MMPWTDLWEIRLKCNLKIVKGRLWIPDWGIWENLKNLVRRMTPGALVAPGKRNTLSRPIRPSAHQANVTNNSPLPSLHGTSPSHYLFPYTASAATNTQQKKCSCCLQFWPHGCLDFSQKQVNNHALIKKKKKTCLSPLHCTHLTSPKLLRWAVSPMTLSMVGRILRMTSVTLGLV